MSNPLQRRMQRTVYIQAMRSAKKELKVDARLVCPQGSNQLHSTRYNSCLFLRTRITYIIIRVVK